MTALKPTKTVFTASQFLDWQRSSTLELSPVFQRRPVWKGPARSQLIDSITRGYPIPIIILRQVQDLTTLKMRMEVVDGQQRLRTLISYLDPSTLTDYDQDRDEVVVRRSHNADIAGKSFAKLTDTQKRAILDYEFSTHILPASAGDELVFRIFARLNSTGLSLNKQEIRNAEYHGSFKSLAYDLSFQYLDSWRGWGVFGNDAIARMDEAEAASEFLITMIEGLGGKSQLKIDRYYKENDEELPASDVLGDRFERVMRALSGTVGGTLEDTVFRRPALFFSLWVAVYDHLYGLKSPLKKKSPASLPSTFASKLAATSRRVAQGDLKDDIQDALDKGTSDPARRRTRHKFLLKALALSGS
jgi:hypothetical protein